MIRMIAISVPTPRYIRLSSNPWLVVRLMQGCPRTQNTSVNGTPEYVTRL